ncbi:hypothetical protein [Haloferax sp. YSMS24]|uniref:hypothetical protein n=1 Tax=Haloferax sp. YSMS24 TaxID=3388425 RepID=UPI00398D2BC3
MTRRSEQQTETRRQTLLFGLLSGVVIVFTGLLTRLSPQVFAPYFGELPPVAVMLGIVALGGVVVSFFLTRGWFVVFEPGDVRRRALLVAGPPTLLATGMALVDSVAVLPEDINVAVPLSLLFYPTIAVVVEVLFHLLPLAVAFVVVSSLGDGAERPELVWGVILVVALLEPLFQLQLGFPRAIPRWATAYVAANVFVINVVQLYLFTRYDFLTMYAFRLVYYLWWHIVWGTLRLQLLF